MSAILEVVLYVPDTAAAAEFLAAAADLVRLESNPDFTVLAAPGGLRIALRPIAFAAGNALGQPLAGPPPPAAELVFGSRDVGASHARALGCGGESLLAPSRPGYGEIATVGGPGGLRLTWFDGSAR